MVIPMYLLLPLASGLGYAVAALLLKRAMAFGLGPWRISFFSNWGMALVGLPFLLIGSTSDGSGLWYQPFLAGGFFFLGQIFTFLALFRGDVSVATPLMGSKVGFVALLTVFLLGEPVPLIWWIGAFLTMAALGLLGWSKPEGRGKIWMSILHALVSAFCFALTDVLVQQWAPGWGVSRFLPLLFLSVGVYSFLFLPFFRTGLLDFEKPGRPWLIGGCALLGLQALGMGVALGVYGQATAVNIVYSTRGIWSVVLIWVVGNWFYNEERLAGRAVMTRRLIGAGLLLAAVVLIMVG